MELELKILKGTTDYLPNEQIIRARIAAKLSRVFELYGFLPLETPILEYYDILASKYAGGAEILKETYKLTDQGQRELALRYDLTIPFSRVLGMNPSLPKPFKRYEIGKVFRDGPVKPGRNREFTQCDVDIAGVKSVIAESELIALTLDVFSLLKIDINVEINNRKLLSGILREAGIPSDRLADTILSIDKLKKIGREEVNKELAEKNIIGPAIEKAFDFLSIGGSPSEILASYQQLLTSDISREGLKELQELFESLKAMNIPEDKITVVSSLARGLEIYTGTVFEIFAKDSPISSSLAAGGRYDKIIGSFLDSDTEIPAVGISFGLEPIYAVIVAQGIRSENDLRIFVISIQSNLYALKIIAQLRKAGIPSELDLRQKGLSKALEYANSQKFTYVVIVGKKEVESGKLTLRNMESGVEERLTIEEVVGKLRKERELSER